MSFTDKPKQGFLGTLFTKKAPMPTSPLSSGTKDIGPEGPGDAHGVPGPHASNRLFSSRRAARRTAEDVASPVDVTGADQAPTPAAPPHGAPAGVEGGSSRLGAMLKKKNGGPPAKKPESKRKLPKAQPATQAKTAAVSSAIILTELENGRSLLWELTRTSFKQVDQAEPASSVLSFSREDLRLVAEKTLAYPKALDMAIEDVGEMVAIVNRSKDLRTVYATREERPSNVHHRIGPGQQALDVLLQKAERAGQSLITGFLLKDPGASLTVAILYHVSAEGGSTKPQITVNPDNMEFVLNQFAAARKINRKETEVHFFGNDDLLSVAGLAQFYPNEKVWNGIPIRVLTNIGAVASGIGAAACIVWTGLGYFSQVRLNADLEKTRAEIARVTAKNNTAISSSLNSFAANSSLDDAVILKHAEKLWLPESRIVLTADPDKTTFNVVVQLTKSAMFHNGPSVAATADDQVVQRLYALVPPDGCTKETTSTTGSFNEIRADVVCQGSASAFSRFRND